MALAYFLGLLGVLIFAATLPATRIALEALDPGFLTFARAVIASAIAFSCLLLLRRNFLSRDWAPTLLSGVFLIFGFPGFMAISMQTIPASHGAVVLGILPVMTAALARLFANEKPSARFWLWSAAGACVVTGFVLLTADVRSGPTGLAGYGWMFVAGVCAAAGYVIFGKLSRTTAGWEIIARALVYCTPITLAGTLWNFDTDVSSLDVRPFFALIYLGAFSMFLGFCAWNAALALGGIAKIGQLQLLQVFFTIAISAVLLGETLNGTTVLAAIAVTAIIAASRNH